MESQDDGHNHSHGHSHSHGLGGTWGTWMQVTALRVTLAAIGLVGVATLVGVVALWPDGQGRAAALEEASSFGLATEQFDATVTEVYQGPCSYATDDATPQTCRQFTVTLHEGPDANSQLALPEYNLSTVNAPPLLAVGDDIKVGFEPSTAFYYYADRDRGSPLLWLAALFTVVVLGMGRWRGLTALAAMASTVVVLVGFVAPSVLDGHDPLLVSVVAGSIIAYVGLYVTHGFTPTTTVALAGTLASLAVTLAVASVFFSLAEFTGLATEEGMTLPLLAADINLSSLLLGGAMIGTLGALDDVTVTQVATVAELSHRNRSLTVAELTNSGIRVGRAHIASTVNTLLLAYVGASMPLVLIFAASNQSLGVVANSEVVAVEIVRTLCGSIGLVAAVPITTVLAAILVGTAHQDGNAESAQGEPDPASHVAVPEPVTEHDVAGLTSSSSADSPPSDQKRPQWDDFAPQED